MNAIFEQTYCVIQHANMRVKVHGEQRIFQTMLILLAEVVIHMRGNRRVLHTSNPWSKHLLVRTGKAGTQISNQEIMQKTGQEEIRGNLRVETE